MTEKMLVASKESWDWDVCIVCGDEQVKEHGMIILVSQDGSVYAGRLGWCDKPECVEDSKQSNHSTFTAEEAAKIDASLAEEAS